MMSIMHSNCKTSDPKINTVRQLVDVHYEPYEVRSMTRQPPPPPFSKTEKDKKLLQAKMDSTAFYGPHNHLKPRRAAFS